MKKLVMVLSMAYFLTACGGVPSDEIIADEVSASKYEKWSCKALKAEISALKGRVEETAKIVDKKQETQGDKQLLAGILFWPIYFYVDENDVEVRKYAKIKGEYNAASSLYNRRECMKKS